MPSLEAPALFGYLEEDGCDELCNDSYQILDGQELLIGRDHKTCDVVLKDLTVSNQHLLIYNIAYIEDDRQRVFVYARDLSTNGSYWCYQRGNCWKELSIGKGNSVLLSDGDKVRLCNGHVFAFRSTHRKSKCLEDTSTVKEEGTKLFSNLFSISERKLGSGAFGEVWMAVDIVRQRQVACKIVKLHEPPQKRFGRVSFSGPQWREVDLLKDISHPNILHVERVFFTETMLYIISDLVTGGDLMSYIERPWSNMDDAEACFIIYQVLKALEYLHRQGICHRDLKPENILMSTPASGARVILADFGHSIKLSGGKQLRSKRMKTAVGTDYYVAPEVRGKKKNTRGYTMASDMWSIGIVTALLFTGESVFANSDNRYASSMAILDAASECDLAKMENDSRWQNVDDLGKDFVKGLLVLDEKVRLDVNQALKHGWFTTGKRQKDIKQKYEVTIRGWMPTKPLLDFKEDLAVYREASKSELDSLMMPPPAKPNLNRFSQWPSHQLQDEQQWSPFFSRAIRNGTTDIAPHTGKKRELESDDSPGPSTDLEYEEHRLHDRVGREEASIFKSARNYGQAVEKRRRLGDY